jgi:23S rRNA (uracil1939-C5)-methyltransferase
MKDRFFRVIAGPINEKGYSVTTEFQEINNLTNKRQPNTIYILGMLPNEEGEVKIFKTKKDTFFAHLTSLTKRSTIRVEPKDIESYLASSPLQIMNYQEELKHKQEFLNNLYMSHISINPEIYTDNTEWNYRNKVEFGFYEDYDNYDLHLSFFKREGGAGKYALEEGSAIADVRINDLGLKIVSILKTAKVSGRDLKTLLIRTSNLSIAANLYVTSEDFLIKYGQTLADEFNSLGVSLIYSNKNSPASNNNGFLIQHSQVLTQDICGQQFNFAVDGFFQINVPLFEFVIQDCKEYITKNMIKGNLIDLYCGVGVIGLLLSKYFKSVVGVDLSLESKNFAINNGLINNVNNYTYQMSAAEKVTEILNNQDILFLDPPRIGCHQLLLDKIKQTPPPYIFYLSCNPVTQQANYEYIKDHYTIEFLKGYNFYPKTPHLECLLILKRID